MTDQLALRVLLGIFVKGSVAVAMGAAVTFALRRHAAAARHVVWTAAMALLLALPALTAVLPRWEVTRDDAVALPTVAPAVPTTATAASAPAPHHDAPAVPPRPPRDRGQPLLTAALALWLTGVVVGLAFLSRDLVRIALVRRRAWAAGPGDRATWYATAIRRALGLSRPVAIAYTNELAVPATSGLVRPIVLLPDGARRWTSDRLRTVLLHELAHVARRDFLPHLMTHVVRACYWPNPLVWSAARRAQLEQERACDDAVLRAGARSHTYAEHLVAVARDLAGPPLAGAALAMARPHTLGQRVGAILRPGLSRAGLARRMLAWTGAGAVLAALPLGTVRLVEARDAREVRAAVLDLASDDPGVRARAAWTLGDAGARKRVPELRRRLADTSALVRGVASWALGEIGAPATVPDLMARLDDADPYVREAAALALGRLEAHAALDRLAVLRHDSVMGVRAVLTVTLERLGGRAAAGLLGDIARTDPDEHARGMALDALCRTDAREARAVLTGLLRDDDPRIRYMAARRLTDLPDTSLVPLLTGVAAHDPEPMVRGAAALALGHTGDPAALAGLRRAQADPEFGVRVSANYALGRLGGTDAAAALLEALRDPVHQVRLSAVEALDGLRR